MTVSHTKYAGSITTISDATGTMNSAGATMTAATGATAGIGTIAETLTVARTETPVPTAGVETIYRHTSEIT